MSSLVTASVFQRWGESVVEIKGKRAEEVQERQAARAEEERKQAVMRRIVGRMSKQALAVCLDAWAEYAAEEGRKRALMTRIVMRLSQRLLSCVFERWCGMVELLTAERVEEEEKRVQEQAEEERKHAVMLRCVSRMITKGVCYINISL